MSIEVEHKGRVYRAVPEVRGCTDCDATSDMCEQNWNTCSVDEIIWIETIQEQTMQEQGAEVTVEYNPKHDLYVLKDKQQKVRKPWNFDSNDLTECIPVQLMLNGFEDEF